MQMINKALKELKSLLALDKNDPLNVKDTLMHIYVYLENEKEALKIAKKIHPRYLLPLSVLYYKLYNFKEAKRYLYLCYIKDKSIKNFNSII